jgi:predicted RNase H-like nuclease
VESLDELSRATPGADAYGIDIPIGLPQEGQRRADVEAREFLGPRRNSVFFTPVREALMAATHREASAISKELTGLGVSQQAFALAPRILEAERWSELIPRPVWEVHPEVSFALMLGHPAAAPKTTWAGMRERLRALEVQGVSLAAVDEAGRHARVDDVLDAAAAAWSAARLLRGEGICLPDPPEVEPKSGRPMAIWA